MDSLLELLEEYRRNRLLDQLSVKELNALVPVLQETFEKAQALLETKVDKEADNPAEEYIELTINGQVDRIKKTIEVLNISCNDYKTLPPAIYKLKNLKMLYLFNNKFSAEEKKKIRRNFPAEVQIHF